MYDINYTTFKLYNFESKSFGTFNYKYVSEIPNTNYSLLFKFFFINNVITYIYDFFLIKNEYFRKYINTKSTILFLKHFFYKSLNNVIFKLM